MSDCNRELWDSQIIEALTSSTLKRVEEGRGKKEMESLPVTSSAELMLSIQCLNRWVSDVSQIYDVSTAGSSSERTRPVRRIRKFVVFFGFYANVSVDREFRCSSSVGGPV
ncbi:hypothetical protein INR49_007132 [Caranx melampygus]|nr:hypothetical protein INR49_007132 [Caranx melampygus]